MEMSKKTPKKTKIWVYFLDIAKPKSENNREKSPNRGKRIKAPWPGVFIF